MYGLTSMWDYFGLDHLQKLGSSLERAGMKPSTLYPHWLALSKALAYLWALSRRADPQAPAPEALHFAMQQKMIARRNRATDARANRETPIEVIAHSRLHSLSHSLYPNLLHYSRPLAYCRIVSQDLKSDARWLSPGELAK
jgi:hypothetical protein